MLLMVERGIRGGICMQYNIYIYIYIYIYMVFTTEEFLELAIQNSPEWDLNP